MSRVSHLLARLFWPWSDTPYYAIQHVQRELVRLADQQESWRETISGLLQLKKADEPSVMVLVLGQIERVTRGASSHHPHESHPVYGPRSFGVGAGVPEEPPLPNNERRLFNTSFGRTEMFEPGELNHRVVLTVNRTMVNGQIVAICDPKLVSVGSILMACDVASDGAPFGWFERIECGQQIAVSFSRRNLP